MVRFAFATIWLIINLTILQLIITKVGMIYTEAEVLRKGNDQILNNLQEGVIILDKKDLKIMFQNKSARA